MMPPAVYTILEPGLTLHLAVRTLLFRNPWDYFRSQREILLQTFPGILESQCASLKKDWHILFKLRARSNFLGVDLCLHKQIKILCHLSASRTAIMLKSQIEGSTACQPSGVENSWVRYTGMWNRYVNRLSVQGIVTDEENEMTLEWAKVLFPSKMQYVFIVQSSYQSWYSMCIYVYCFELFHYFSCIS